MNISVLKFAAASALAALALTAAPAAFADIVVPGSSADHPGNSNQSFPFNRDLGASMRYQQFYAASQFGAAPVTLTSIKFRLAADASSPGHAFDSTIANIKLNLATSPNTVAAYSTTFASNVGADNQTVFDGALHLSSVGAPAGPDGTRPFDVVINFDNPFVYDPTAGDLMLDVFNFSGGLTTTFDFITGGSDATSLIFSLGGVNAATGFARPGSGLVTAFGTAAAAAVPEPAAWGLMILGFGLVGGLARRRRGLVAA